MVVKTDSPRVITSRRLTLGLLLSSGHHNCVSRAISRPQWTALQLDAAAYDKAEDLCEVYGTCKLQEHAYRYQADSGRFTRDKADYGIELENPLIVRDFSRCILCGRCAQACNEVQVNNAISQGYRGKPSKIVTVGDNPLASSDCVFCGECVRVCPVGALVDKKSRFRARPWETKKIRSVCHHCGVGCALELHVKDGKIVRVTGAEKGAPNRGSLCMRGRFAYDFVHSEKRLTAPLIRENGKHRKASWDEALSLVAEKLKKTKSDAVACIASPKATNEDLYLLQKLFRAAGSANITVGEQVAFKGVFMRNTFDDLEKAPVVVLVGSDITRDNPVAGAFIKRGVLAGNRLIVIDSRETRISKHASVHLKANTGTEGVVVSGLIHQISGKHEKFSPEKTAETAGVKPEALSAAAAAVREAGSCVLVYDPNVVLNTDMLAGFHELAGGNVNALAGNNNTAGACYMGAVPAGQNKGRTLPEIEKALANGAIRFLYCAGGSPVLQGIAGKAGLFTVAQDQFETPGSLLADVVLPQAAWSEYEGTTVSAENRVNLVTGVVQAPGEAKPGWWIAAELAGRLGQAMTVKSARELWENEITANIPGLNGITYAEIEKGRAIIQADVNGNEPVYAPGWKSAEYHHKVLIEQSRELSDVLERRPAEKVNAALGAFLKDEGLSDKKAEADAILDRYRGRPGSIIPVLQQFQELLGYLPVVVQEYIALGLNIAPSDIYGIVTFYAFFTMVPRGKHVIKICLGTACYVMGAQELVQRFGEVLNVKVGGTTPDRAFSLESVRCVGACGLAPVVLVNENTHGKLTIGQVPDLVKTYQAAS
jgi:predicted molibdopterin-dependent oxidoreductase YjgC/NADH:ubiquinone oxidoreductase subunit E